MNSASKKAMNMSNIAEAKCPGCKVRGDFLQPINPLMKNCIDFCEFPHKCYKDRDCEVLWKTHSELSDHTIYDCPKFGCDICFDERFQHMSRHELFNHIKRDCPEVMV
jgi:hypothetical protein